MANSNLIPVNYYNINNLVTIAWNVIPDYQNKNYSRIACLIMNHKNINNKYNNNKIF